VTSIYPASHLSTATTRYAYLRRAVKTIIILVNMTLRYSSYGISFGPKRSEGSTMSESLQRHGILLAFTKWCDHILLNKASWLLDCGAIYLFTYLLTYLLKIAINGRGYSDLWLRFWLALRRHIFGDTGPARFPTEEMTFKTKIASNDRPAACFPRQCSAVSIDADHTLVKNHDSLHPTRV